MHPTILNFQSLLLFLLLLIGLTGCGGDSSSQTDNQIDSSPAKEKDDPTPSNDDSDSSLQGAVAQFQSVNFNNDLNTPYPVAVYLKLKANASSTYQLLENQNTLESGVMPIGTLIGPASGLRSRYSSIEIIQVLTGDNDHTLTFSITTPEDEHVSSDETIAIAGRPCMENSTFFNRYIEDELDNRCGSCHSNQGTASGWSVDDSYTELLDYADRRGMHWVTHAEDSNHGGGRSWDLDDDDALHLAEFVYRAKNDFSCP